MTEVKLYLPGDDMRLLDLARRKGKERRSTYIRRILETEWSRHPPTPNVSDLRNEALRQFIEECVKNELQRAAVFGRSPIQIYRENVAVGASRTGKTAEEDGAR